MKHFAALFYRLEEPTSTEEKVAALVQYLHQVDDADKLWMIALYTGRKPKRSITSALQKKWAAELTKIPEWLFEECYNAVGDVSETIALLLPDTTESSDRSLTFWINYLHDTIGKEEADKKAAILAAWQQMSKEENLVFNKICTSTFKTGISQNIISRALSVYGGINTAVIMHRLMGNWNAENTTLEELLGKDTEEQNEISIPYPFLISHSLNKEPESLGNASEWFAEWKWDGIRAQIIKREGTLFIWNKSEEPLTDKFPDLSVFAKVLPDGTVLDSEILPYSKEKILSFHHLQSRISKSKLNSKILEDSPVAVFAFDLLEYKGEDIRMKPLSERRILLEKLISETAHPQLKVSPLLNFNQWDELKTLRDTARIHSAEGIILKRKISVYNSEKENDYWRHWKTNPFTINAVLIYAQTGLGKRANLFADYSFGIWDNEQLLSFAKTGSGLSESEIKEIDKWVRLNIMEKFGPVRTVKPALVFELGFEGIQESKRHKSGIVLRSPRILRWRRDKKIEEADSLEKLKGILVNL